VVIQNSVSTDDDNRRAWPTIFDSPDGFDWTENAEYRRGVTRPKLIVEFEFGANRASDGLRPGQGSWLDRAMQQGEPTRLEYFVFEGDPQKIIDYLRASGHYYTVECFNTGKGYLQATKAYPR
jgi:hypothetical protein